MTFTTILRRLSLLKHELESVERSVIDLKGKLKWDIEVPDKLFEDYNSALSKREFLEEEIYHLSQKLELVKTISLKGINNVIPFYRRSLC